jgi:uncharacterized membrane protein
MMFRNFVWPAKLSSRKFWLAVVGAFLLVLKEGLGLEIDGEAVLAFAAIVLGYIVTEGYIDAKGLPPHGE